ncbi:YagK/YfjJ domain-containing protein [Aeromonas veronii]|uniref:YagK/YfjJ domain-containing protein n=2 Tax=Aeromonas veronii TaxID=654 RepID=UPI0029D6CD88|nr:inovirus-type Gp2 protein [Aeromonas veronii]MDX7746776.1 inovirus-type Gp2 protein [Aeromonas veronii]
MSTDILDFIHQLEVRYPSFSIHAFQKAMDAVTEHYYHYREAKSAHPSVELFLKYFYRYHDLDVYDDCLSAEAYSELLTELNDVLSDFMHQLRSPRHQKQLHNLKRADKRNSDSIQKYINALFDKYARLLVVRVDVHFRDDVTLEEAQEEREYYLRTIKRRFTRLVGYIWKLEYGESRGYHYHIAFIFNGKYLQNDIKIGRLLGERWHAGSYYNCNAKRSQYEEWGTDGIGMIHRSDDEKRQKLFMYAMKYLVKMDEAVLAQTCGRSNRMGKMEVPGRRMRVLRVSLE